MQPFVGRERRNDMGRTMAEIDPDEVLDREFIDRPMNNHTRAQCIWNSLGYRGGIPSDLLKKIKPNGTREEALDKIARFLKRPEIKNM